MWSRNGWTDPEQTGAWSFDPDARSTAKPGQCRRYKMCWGDRGGWVSGLRHSGAFTFLQAECSNEKSELSAAGAQGQGLACVSSHAGATLVVWGAAAGRYNQRQYCYLLYMRWAQTELTNLHQASLMEAQQKLNFKINWSAFRCVAVLYLISIFLLWTILSVRRAPCKIFKTRCFPLNTVWNKKYEQMKKSKVKKIISERFFEAKIWISCLRDTKTKNKRWNW